MAAGIRQSSWGSTAPGPSPACCVPPRAPSVSPRKSSAPLALLPIHRLFVAALLASLHAEVAVCQTEVSDVEEEFSGASENEENCSAVTEPAWREGQDLLPPSRFPYIASISRHGDQQHVCTGVLIHPEYVLTAAHCVDPDDIYSAGLKPLVHIGGVAVDDTRENVETRLVSETEFRKEWWASKGEGSPFNVAVLRLKEKSKKQVPQLFDDQFTLSTSHMLSALGWGYNDIGLGDEIFGSLKVEMQHYINGKDCNRSALGDGEIAEGLICGLNDARQASCIVDSGGPLILPNSRESSVTNGNPAHDLLIGINTAAGKPCKTPGKPDIYISIMEVSPWICSTILDFPDCKRTPVVPEPGEKVPGIMLPMVFSILIGGFGMLALLLLLGCQRGLRFDWIDFRFRWADPRKSDDGKVESPFHGHRQRMKQLYKTEKCEFLTVVPDKVIPMDVKKEVVVYVNQELGRGASSVVKKGRYMTQDVAVRYSGMSNLQRELKILEKVQRERHPNIVELLGVSELPEEGKGFVVMELMTCSLGSLLRDPLCVLNITYSQLLEIFLNIVDGLICLHSLDPPISHMDLKPDNILVRMEQTENSSTKITAKLCDFDHSKQRLQDLVTGKWVGTLGYMAPELLKHWNDPEAPNRPSSEKYSGEKIDVYSFGCVVRNCLGVDSTSGSCSSVADSGLVPAELAEMARECMNEHGDKRPDLQNLRQRLLLLIRDGCGWLDLRLKRRMSEAIVRVREGWKRRLPDNVETMMDCRMRCQDFLNLFESILRELHALYESSGARSVELSPKDVVLERSDSEGYRARVLPIKGTNQESLEESVLLRSEIDVVRAAGKFMANLLKGSGRVASSGSASLSHSQESCPKELIDLLVKCNDKDEAQHGRNEPPTSRADLLTQLQGCHSQEWTQDAVWVRKSASS